MDLARSIDGYNALRALPLFIDLEDKIFKGLLESAHIKSFNKDKLLFQQGDAVKFLYVIQSGAVKTSRSSDEGDEIIMDLFKQGDVFMETAVFLHAPSPVSAQVIKEAELILIPAEAVYKYARTDRQFSNNLLNTMSLHYESAIQQIDVLTLKTPVQRVAYYLLKLFIEGGSKDHNIQLPHQKSLIATHLGMTPETFSRVLKQLSAEDDIRFEKNQVFLPNLSILCQYCDANIARQCDRFDADKCPSTGCDLD